MNLSERQTTYLTTVISLQLEPDFFSLPRELSEAIYGANLSMISSILPVLPEGMRVEDVKRIPGIFKTSAVAHLLAEMNAEPKFDRFSEEEKLELMDDWAIIELAESHIPVAQAILEALPGVEMAEFVVDSMDSDMDAMLQQLTSEGSKKPQD